MARGRWHHAGRANPRRGGALGRAPTEIRKLECGKRPTGMVPDNGASPHGHPRAATSPESSSPAESAPVSADQRWRGGLRSKRSLGGNRAGPMIDQLKASVRVARREAFVSEQPNRSDGQANLGGSHSPSRLLDRHAVKTPESVDLYPRLWPMPMGFVMTWVPYLGSGLSRQLFPTDQPQCSHKYIYLQSLTPHQHLPSFLSSFNRPTGCCLWLTFGIC